ncbi:hypothetical protein DICVIV_03314 [Dictyocaulus viviparus]|uniref:EF-hand domain-containing protein n=1 Tax=Dictyocaulus viviparus TaxID=29172 RepID=A0A0D8Y3E6_DICVI|nr:hypothetical protein DICVIV_03314 [Dictyocaulus viviparus]
MNYSKEHQIFRGVLFTNPLRVVKHVLDGDGPSRVRLKLVNNCDILPDLFTNDIFAVIADGCGRVVAVTTHLNQDSYETEEFQLGSDYVVTVIALGATIQENMKSKQKIDLTENGKLSKRFKMALMNVFDMFDFDYDGLLSRSEYDAFVIATGDTPPDDEEWELLTSQFDARDGCLTVAGFLFMHECEAFSGDELAIPDIWESLYRLGYNNDLKLCQAIPYTIEIENDDVVVDKARLTAMTRSERDQILRGLYYRGKPDTHSQINVHIFTADYFGMMIVHNLKKEGGKTYRIEITKEQNVKWNFYHGKDGIDPFSCGDWILVCSYRSIKIDHVVEFHLVEEQSETNGTDHHVSV